MGCGWWFWRAGDCRIGGMSYIQKKKIIKKKGIIRTQHWKQCNQSDYIKNKIKTETEQVLQIQVKEHRHMQV